jgi:N-acetylmuramoyl-L-alanine amidase
VLTVALVLALNLAVLALALWFAPRSAAAAYRTGSSGATVKTIQLKLIQWGYLNGAADGIYGSRTAEAVKYFQRRNGLTVDGVCGASTLRALGIQEKNAIGSNSYQNDLLLLSKLISAEARGEPYSGQVAVGGVVLNRVKHPSFPNTLSGVIYQNGAFSCLRDGQFDKPVTDSARRAAQDALNGSDTSGGAIYYYNPATATSSWIRSRPIIKQIGRHLFCK